MNAASNSKVTCVSLGLPSSPPSLTFKPSQLPCGPQLIVRTASAPDREEGRPLAVKIRIYECRRGTGAHSRLQRKIKQSRLGSIIIQSESNAKQGADIIRWAQTFGINRPKNMPTCQTGPIVFLSWCFIFTAPSSGLPAAQCIVMLSYSLSQSSFADSKWSHKCDGSPQIALFRMLCSCIFYNDRERFNPALTLKFSYAISFFAHSVISEEATVKIQFYRSETSTPQQRPAATKWLQWIKSKWDLWINRDAALVVANDGKMDEPQPAEMASWFALCIPSIPWVWERGGAPSQHVSGRQWHWWERVRVHRSMSVHPQHPPGLLVPACLSQMPRKNLRPPAGTQNTRHLRHATHKTLESDSDFASV